MRISRKRILLISLALLLAVVLSGWTLTQRQSALPATTTTQYETTTTTTTPVRTEIVAGVTIYDETTFWYGNAADDARKAIEQTMALLPDHLADQVRAVPTYLVDSATRCPKSAGACFSYDADGHPFVELIMDAGGRRLWTVVHEYGHVVGNTLTPWGTTQEASYVHDVFVTASEDNPPTRYGRTRVAEDYADSFALYVLDSEQLKACCPARYAYFHDLFTNP